MTLSSFSNSASASTGLATQIHVNYELVRGTESQVIDELMPIIRQESVALNLSGVERIDAAGIAALITLYCTSVEAGTEFSVVDPSAHVLELLKLVGLEPILMAGDRPTGSSRRRFGRCAA
jgi:anti-anti-sigma factor